MAKEKKSVSVIYGVLNWRDDAPHVVAIDEHEEDAWVTAFLWTHDECAYEDVDSGEAEATLRGEGFYVRTATLTFDEEVAK